MSPGRRAARVGFLAALLFACRPGETGEEQTLETVDVPPPLEIDIADDARARQPAPALVGVLPQDFPTDLPVYLPASIVDFGTGERGRFSVSFLSPHSHVDVRRGLKVLLEQRGWAFAAGDHGGGLRLLRKGGREAWLRIDERGSATAYRYEY